MLKGRGGWCGAHARHLRVYNGRDGGKYLWAICGGNHDGHRVTVGSLNITLLRTLEPVWGDTRDAHRDEGKERHGDHASHQHVAQREAARRCSHRCKCAGPLDQVVGDEIHKIQAPVFY